MSSTIQEEQLRATYSAVQTDRDRIDREIEKLAAERDELNRISSYLDKRLGKSPEVVVAKEQEPAGTWASLTTADACEAYLRSVGPPERDTNEIIEGIQNGGWTTYAEKPYTTVFGTLNREWKKPDSRFFKLHGRWGLEEWAADEPQPAEIPGIRLQTFGGD